MTFALRSVILSTNTLDDFILAFSPPYVFTLYAFHIYNDAFTPLILLAISAVYFSLSKNYERATPLPNANDDKTYKFALISFAFILLVTFGIFLGQKLNAEHKTENAHSESVTDSNISESNNSHSTNTIEPPQKSENIYLQIDNEFSTQLNGSNKVLKVQIAVMTQHGNNVIDNLQKHQNSIKSPILNLMQNTTETELISANGRTELASKIMFEINKILQTYEGYGGIDDVFFTSFVLK